MSKKFIPNGDLDFKTMATGFARNIAADPARFEISSADSVLLTAAFQTYDHALMYARGAMRSAQTTLIKEQARLELEQIIRRLAHHVRANPKMNDVARVALGIPLRTERPKITPCPQDPPKLQFISAKHESALTPTHELYFSAQDRMKAKPPGAVRLELFVDLVPPNEEVPAYPGANSGGRPWYMRSYTRSPIIVVPPMSREPMRVVYWGRWADSTGNVGPFSATATAWIEGGNHHLMGPDLRPFGRSDRPALVASIAGNGPADRAEKYRIAVLEVQVQSFRPTLLESSPRPAQLEGPSEKQSETRAA